MRILNEDDMDNPEIEYVTSIFNFPARDNWIKMDNMAAGDYYFMVEVEPTGRKDNYQHLPYVVSSYSEMDITFVGDEQIAEDKNKWIALLM